MPAVGRQGRRQADAGPRRRARRRRHRRRPRGRRRQGRASCSAAECGSLALDHGAVRTGVAVSRRDRHAGAPAHRRRARRQRRRLRARCSRSSRPSRPATRRRRLAGVARRSRARAGAPGASLRGAPRRGRRRPRRHLRRALHTEARRPARRGARLATRAPRRRCSRTTSGRCMTQRSLSDAAGPGADDAVTSRSAASRRGLDSLRAARRRSRRRRPRVRPPARHAPRRPPSRGRLAAYLLVAVLALVIGARRRLRARYFSRPARSAPTVTVVVPEGASLRRSPTSSRAKGVVKHARAFVIKAEADGYATTLHARHLHVPRERAVRRASSRSCSRAPGRRRSRSRIPRALTLEAGGARSSTAMSSPSRAADYVRVATRTIRRAFTLEGYKTGTTLEGMLFPATYEVLPKKASARAFVDDQLAAFEANFAKVDMTRARARPTSPSTTWSSSPR